MTTIASLEKLSSFLTADRLSFATVRLALSSLGSGLLSDEAFLKAFHEGSYRLFVDMDGVMTDWEKQYEKFSGKPYVSHDETEWKHCNKLDFWKDMDWLPGGRELWEMFAPLHPLVLSSPGPFKAAREGKTIWNRENLGSGVKVILDQNKGRYADTRSILVDDMEKNIKDWEANGGIAIHYTGNPAKAAKDLYKAIVK
jgi:hypothetical protein